MSIFNGELIELARVRAKQAASEEKIAFVDAGTATGGDPAAAGGMPPGGDPMAAMMGGGGGDPMAAMMGGDPAAAGGAPPPPPPVDPAMEARIAALEAAGGGGGAGGVEPIKPKIDVNVEIMRMNKLLARIVDHMGIQVPASDMVATSDDLTQMGMEGAEGAEGGAGGAPPTSAIAPIEAMGAAAPGMGGEGGGAPPPEKAASNGHAVPQSQDFRKLGNKAAAMAQVLRARQHAR